MSGLADKVLSIITDGRGPAEVPGTFRERADALRQLAGSVREAARLAGVDRRTYQRWYQRWASGQDPRPQRATAGKLEQGIRAARVSRDLAGERDVSLTVVDRAGRDQGRERTISGASLKLRPGTLRAAADAWIRTGDPEQAGSAFLAGVGDPFYARWLRPAPGDIAPTPQTGRTGGAPASDDDDSDVYDDDADDDGGDEYDDLDAYDAYYDAVDDSATPDVPDDYGADVTG